MLVVWGGRPTHLHEMCQPCPGHSCPVLVTKAAAWSHRGRFLRGSAEKMQIAGLAKEESPYFDMLGDQQDGNEGHLASVSVAHALETHVILRGSLPEFAVIQAKPAINL